MAAGCLQGDLAPGPLALGVFEMFLALFQFVGSQARVVHSQALDGDCRQLTPGAAGMPVASLRRQLALRAGNGQFVTPAFRLLVVRQIVQGTARLSLTIGLQLAPGTLPDVFATDALGGDQGIKHRPAGLGGFEHGQPQTVGLGEHAAVAACQAGLLLPAGDIGLGSEQCRVLALDLVPCGALAEPANPVGAQALGNVASLVALKEGANGLAIAAVHLHAQPVVFHVGRQFVIADAGGGLFQTGAIAVAEGIAGGQEGFVACLLGSAGQGESEAEQAGEDELQLHVRFIRWMMRWG
jgi:hypothetical protein